jgi:hypothetical protein
MPDESVYADALKKRGFRPFLYDAKEFDRVREVVYEKLSFLMSEHEEDPSEQRVPAFFYSHNGNTIATDERGVFWVAEGRIDLSSLGFKDALPGMIELMKMLRVRLKK